MAGTGSVRGRTGLLKWQYYDAAKLESWVVTRTGAEWSLVAFVVERNAYKLAQRPLVFVAPWTVKATASKPAQQGQWTWPVQSFTIADSGRLTARLAPPLDFAVPAGVERRM